MASNLQKKDEQIILLETKLDDLEQYTRKFNLEICGIPEDEDEDLEDTIFKLSECLHGDLRVKDIDIIHQFKKGNMAPKPIIVRFSNYFSKDEMYRSRWKLRNANVSSVFGAEKIYINENLTTRRAVFFLKRSATKSACIRNGNYGQSIVTFSSNLAPPLEPPK